MKDEPRYPNSCERCVFLFCHETGDFYYCPSHLGITDGRREAVARVVDKDDRNHQEIPFVLADGRFQENIYAKGYYKASKECVRRGFVCKNRWARGTEQKS